MVQKSLINQAYEILEASKKPIAFKDLFEKAIKECQLELDEAGKRTKMGSLYTTMTIDGRFVKVEDGKWDLANRYTYDVSHPKIEDVYDESDESEEEDDEEEKRLLKAELGETEDAKDSEEDTDDIDFDKPKQESDEDNY